MLYPRIGAQREGVKSKHQLVGLPHRFGNDHPCRHTHSDYAKEGVESQRYRRHRACRFEGARVRFMIAWRACQNIPTAALSSTEHKALGGTSLARRCLWKRGHGGDVRRFWDWSRSQPVGILWCWRPTAIHAKCNTHTRRNRPNAFTRTASPDERLLACSKLFIGWTDISL